jgi:transposase
MVLVNVLSILVIGTFCALRAALSSAHFCAMARPKKEEGQALRNRAFQLYMNTDSSLADIAKAVGVGSDTISDWARKNKWQETKGANSITREKNISMMLVQINNLLEDINKRDQKWPTASEADTVTKMSNNIRSLSGRTSLPDFFNVQMEFLKFMHTANPALAKQVVDVSKEFLQSKARELEA